MTRKNIYAWFMACVALVVLSVATGCSDGETYAEQKEKEVRSISRFLEDNDFVGKINPISEEQFREQDSMTNLAKNEFVKFNDDGIYMQVVRRGEGPTMAELAKQYRDSTVTRYLLCKFLEYDIQAGDTTYTNIYMTGIKDKMTCTYSDFSRSYTASFTEGVMRTAYGSAVPQGWLKPLDYIRLSKVDGEEAKVRLIVPHTSGTQNASGHVRPFYYEITYQVPPNF